MDNHAYWPYLGLSWALRGLWANPGLSSAIKDELEASINENFQ